MTLNRLIYVSRPFGFDSAMLGSIMIAARRNNRRDGLTGALICRADIYLQLLEGPAAAVAATYGRIVEDDRHCDIERLVATTVEDRLFPAWDMLDDPARSWLWTAREVAAGAVLAGGATGVTAVFERLAAEQQAGFSAPAPACPAAAMA